MLDSMQYQDCIAALEWYVDQGVTDIVLDDVIDRTKPQDKPPQAFLGKHEAYHEAVKLANTVTTLQDLQQIIAAFDGIALKKTASNMVFADGNPRAHIMVIGDAPGTDEDAQGRPFLGAHGQLLDKILACIGLDRCAEEAQKSVYLTTILNWRPPGNRTPNAAEIEVSLPFIERHIQLIQPKILILCGSIAAKSLLGRSESLSRLRQSWHEYMPQTKGIQGNTPILARVTYPPSSLLNTPLQKKAVWADMLEIQEKLQ